MALVWSDNCIPAASNAVRDTNYSECCSARFTFSVSGSVPAGPYGTYYPNKCTRSPSTASVTIGPMIVDMEVVSDGIVVDDELLVNSQAYEPGNYPTILGEGTTATGANFPGGPSACNGQHRVVAGKVLATISQGDSVVLAGGDNHGIDLFMRGAVIVRPVVAP